MDQVTNIATTTESLPDLKLSIQQPKNGYRYNMDPFILADFVTLEKDTTTIDLGTGVGIIPLLLARRFPQAGQFKGVEIQPELANIAWGNVNQNDLQQQITIIQEDYRNYREIAPPSSFSTVIANPPYYPQHRGRLNTCRQKAIARHEITTNLDTLIKAAAFFLKPGGCFFVSYPAERLPSILTACSKRKLTPKKLQCLHSQPTQPAELIVLLARQNGKEGLQITPPRFLRP
ncbi:MAG: methyltransferase [Xanthomonadaceae bacterium]|nr:methyltransferase [Xanthomonadaceae bacterium]